MRYFNITYSVEGNTVDVRVDDANIISFICLNNKACNDIVNLIEIKNKAKLLMHIRSLKNGHSYAYTINFNEFKNSNLTIEEFLFFTSPQNFFNYLLTS
jgi:hypothetical protein